ncbi:RNA polymerase sigma factor [Tundrisphaera sp. TA3]|uniref:RNA polymerase sigma factor n=1 Tax=Tundrisphaera sp. TA3 TaxID=3435775 RepID=UPI003EC06FE7
MTTDAELVRAVLDGDRDAFAQLATRHQRLAWATAWRVLRDDHAASDAAQEALFQAYRGLSGLRDPSQFGAWLARIARREAVRVGRRRMPDSMPNGDGPPQPEARSVFDDRDAGLLEAVGRLKEHERVVVVMHYLEGRPVAEVALTLGRPVGTITKRLSRAVRNLRERLGVKDPS